MFELFTFGMTFVCHAEHLLFGAFLGESSYPLAADAGLGRGPWRDISWIPCGAFVVSVLCYYELHWSLMHIYLLALVGHILMLLLA